MKRVITFAAILVTSCVHIDQRSSAACGVAFRFPAGWVVESASRGNECVVSISPADLAERMASEAADENLTDRYTITIFVSTVGETMDEDVIDRNARRFAVAWGGWSGFEAPGATERLYFEGGPYCCLSAAPVTVLRDAEIGVVVVGKVASEREYEMVRKSITRTK